MALMRVVSLLLFCASEMWAGEHPLEKDRTGMQWVLPFKQAREKAKQGRRLLLIKPVAFGTSPDGGWYYAGLGLFHSGKKEEAIRLWGKTITGCSQDPWIYRCDWAYCNAKANGGRKMFSSSGPRTSLLNRIGYMGRKNPDLAPRK